MRRYSFSKISTYLRCPRLFRHRYIDRDEPERLSLALPIGSAMHDAIQWEVSARAKGHVAEVTEIARVFQELLEARVEISDCPVSGDLSESQDLGQKMIEAYVNWGRIQGVSTIEGEHLVQISDEIELEGRIDFVRDNEDGIEILELKTSARAWSQDQADLSLQAAAYAELTGIRSVRFIVLTKTKAPKVQELLTHCGELELFRLRDTIREVDAGIRASSFPRNCSPQTCRGCEFRDRCLGTSQLQLCTRGSTTQQTV